MKLNRTIENALPLLFRERVIDAVLRTQSAFGGPVTANEVRAAQPAPLLRHSRALTELCHQIVELGPDEKGRALYRAGKDRTGLLLWWVEAPQDAKRPAAKKAPAKKKAARKASKKKRAGKKRARA